MKILSKIYTALIFLFLFAPIIVMIIFSFNGDESLSVLNGFSLRWYKNLFEDEATLKALYNTVILAVCSSVIATVLGTAAAVGIDKFKKGPIRSGVMATTNIPMMNPEIVTGVSMMLLFVFVGKLISANSALGFGTLLIAHVTFGLPYVILNILPKLRQTDRNLAEAAQDLGCKPSSAFFKVVLPSIMPGIITGMITVFTLSLDDFIISYFTSGTGFRTLPIAIFSMTKKNVKPDMYALSALIFVSILVLLILYNVAQTKSDTKANDSAKRSKGTSVFLNKPGIKKGIIAAVIVVSVVSATCLFIFTGNSGQTTGLEGTTLYVYNWGEYISDGEDDTLDVNAAFEEKYGIEVVYDTFDNNEAMHSKLKSGGVSYDIVIPSDYMIERMIDEDMLAEIDFSNIPNYKYIPSEYRNLAHDPENKYSVPYTAGMVGLIYNTTMVEEAPDSWNALWDEKYAGDILMFNNQRDAFAIAQSLLGTSYNSNNPDEWRAAAKLLKEQKSVSPTYVNDEIFLKMESGEAALAPYYAGDFYTMYDNNNDLAFVYPKEGVNLFVDAMCITKNARNKEAAELYINFMLEPDVALANAEYICYASPHTAVYNNPEYSFYQDEILYPEDGKFKTETFLNLDKDILDLESSLWEDVKGHDASQDDGEEGVIMTPEAKKYAIYIGIFILICLAYIIFRYARKKYREKVK